MKNITKKIEAVMNSELSKIGKLMRLYAMADCVKPLSMEYNKIVSAIATLSK